jgi:2-oxoglutarate ferredoxin oxidoreductase subunit alpha
MNLGQLALLVRGMFLVDAIGVNQVRGLPFRVDELVGAVRSVIDGTAVRTVIGTAGRFGTMNGVPTIEVGEDIDPPDRGADPRPAESGAAEPPAAELIVPAAEPVPAHTNGASR